MGKYFDAVVVEVEKYLLFSDWLWPYCAFRASFLNGISVSYRFCKSQTKQRNAMLSSSNTVRARRKVKKNWRGEGEVHSSMRSLKEKVFASFGSKIGGANGPPVPQFHRTCMLLCTT